MQKGKMRKMVWLSLLLFWGTAVNCYGIGISPGRWTVDLYENNCTFNSDATYTLYRPSTRYSRFTTNDVFGLTTSLTGCSISDGIEYISDTEVLIDWQSEALSSLSTITASIHVESPESWDCPVEPGGGAYMDNLVCHSEMVESGSGIVATAAVVSQISFWRNYAPRIYLQESTTTDLTAQVVLQFEDKQSTWWSYSSDAVWFGYEIDWDSDGIVDQAGTSTFDEEPTPGSPLRWTSGIQTSTVPLGHTYETAGDYVVTVSVRDYYNNHYETTTMQIPVTVVPEPAILSLLGLGGMLLRKAHWNRRTL